MYALSFSSNSPPLFLLPSYDSLSLISNTLTFFPSLDPLQDLFSLPPRPSYLKQGGRNGTDTAYIYRTGTHPINTHRKWQTKAPRPQGMGERKLWGGGGSDTNMVFYLYVRMGKHRLKWLQRCFRGDTLSVIMTHRPASCHFFPPAGTTCSSRAHKHTHT